MGDKTPPPGLSYRQAMAQMNATRDSVTGSMSQSDPVYLYEVRPEYKTIRYMVTNITKQFPDEHIDFFNSLNGKNGTRSQGNWYEISDKMPDEVLAEVNTIFKAAKKSTGGSRRRPSRKYKKSKRVMRRKSRSTRRR